MSKIFQRNRGPEVNVNRNTFDLSYASHLTGKLGKWIPCFCQEVLPGDSFQIDPAFGLRFNPMQFPIQSKVHSVMHFWYVRNRNLWKDWPEYITKTKDGLVHPYLHITEDNAKDIIGTGSIGDYLGVPTTVTGDYAQYMNVDLNISLPAEAVEIDNRRDSNHTFNSLGFNRSALNVVNSLCPQWLVPTGMSNVTDMTTLDARTKADFENGVDRTVSDSTHPSWTGTQPPYACYGYFSRVKLDDAIDGSRDIVLNGGVGMPGTLVKLDSDAGAYIVIAAGRSTTTPLGSSCVYRYVPVGLNVESGTFHINAGEVDKIAEIVNPLIGSHSVYLGLFFQYSKYSATDDYLTDPSVFPTSASYKRCADSLMIPSAGLVVRDATSPTAVAFNPFVVHSGETVPKIKLNALPFRAYEQVYRAGYQDQIVDPFIKDGLPVYNDFVTTHEGGADTTPYHLFDRYWERDYYTSCTPTPQMGTAPLVGISATGEFTFDDGTNTYTATATIGDDGETITGISTYSPDMPKGSLRQLMDVVTNGISINDLRNVNSLQKFLENSLRRGYQYVDQIYTHFGVTPGYKANDMPDFLGGIHVTADVNQVNDTGTNLGDYAGQMSVFGSSNNKISKYCDEGGFIIGVMSTFAEPCYSQMLPKYFTKTMTALDYYFPEFNHIGMQPISYNEVCPLEVAAYDVANSTDTINDTFGYQRAWADYLANTDQVHGDFRTSLSNFIISRVFHSKPQLGHDFISINHDEIDDVFVVTDDTDKMLGELRFDVKAQRPIPLYGIPSIE